MFHLAPKFHVGSQRLLALLPNAFEPSTRIVAEIEYYRRHMPSPDAATVITGGQAALVADKVAFDSVVEPNLVSIGLNRIIDYNENI